MQLNYALWLDHAMPIRLDNPPVAMHACRLWGLISGNEDRGAAEGKGQGGGQRAFMPSGQACVCLDDTARPGIHSHQSVYPQIKSDQMGWAVVASHHPVG